MQRVNVPAEVKASIIDALKSSNGCLSKGIAALQDNGVGNHVLWACKKQLMSQVILVWHIATDIFETGHGASFGCSTDKKITTQLTVSRLPVGIRS